MEHTETIPYFRELIVFLVAAGIVVPVFHRLRLSPVLGFLAVGLLIGPHGLALFADRLPWLAWITIGDIAGVRLIAEFGIIFLLFMIGLELSLDRLWQMKRLVLGLGLAQVLIAAAVIGGIAMAFGNSAPAALILGSCLALSSTAIVMQLLIESRRGGTPVGRASFAILLMQDLAVVPILFMIGFLATAGTTSNQNLLLQLGQTLLIAVIAIVAIIVVGRRVLGPLFRLAGGANSPELFMALILLVVIAMAAATGVAGLSMALGAFLAGLLLAESEYRHAVEVSIEPFKGLLLGLFFLSVGMGIDLRVATDDAVWILLSVIGLFAIKGGIIAALALLFGQSRATALEMALLLGQGGEFAFVVVGLGERYRLLPAETAQFMLLVVSLSMLATPFIAQAARRMARAMADRVADAEHGVGAETERQDGHVVICGYGRVGRMIATLLDAEQIPWVAVDSHAETVAAERRAGRPVHYGDASRVELLEKLSAGRAQAMVVTLDDAAAAGHLVATAHRAWPHLPVFARARDHGHAGHLRKLGATQVIAEAAEASLQLGALALEQAGLPEDAVRQRLERARSAGGPAGD
ncbi:cation:proton antiporter [Ferrovibrio sp.]|uniref:cation:proton antiporter domain-containing protein n=1 Tax=Ferrovibrio sp. TaxID=1917215 RepID=UPI002619C3AA|nr:cation:proton antiporter [Ferrovibrio sp.]